MNANDEHGVIVREDLRNVVDALLLRAQTLGAALILADADLASLLAPDCEMAWLARLAAPALEGDQPLIRQLLADEFVRITPCLLVAQCPIMQRRRCIGRILMVMVQTCPDDVTPEQAVQRLRPFWSGPAEQWSDIISHIQPVRSHDEAMRKRQALSLWIDDLSNLNESASQIQTFGKQLADAYEELTLLHKIGRHMNVVRRPQQFIDLVCRELHEVMPFEWIGIELMRCRKGADDFSRSFYFHGDLHCEPHEAGRAVSRYLEQAVGCEPVVVEEGGSRTVPELAILGSNLIVQPLVDDGVVVGAVMAGRKVGQSHQITSFDMKLLDATAEHIRIFLDNVALYDNLERMFLGVLEALTASIDAKDRYTCGHSRRVAYLSRELARAVGLDESVVERVHIAGLVHDVGKIGVPEAVLCKPGKLTDEEFELIKLHPEIGVRILKDIPNFDDVMPGVLSHHERYDGRGYPQGLVGQNIPLFGRLIGIADCFDAMSSTRTYRRAMSREQVLREIQRCAGTQFDPDMANVFVKLDFRVYDAMAAKDQKALEQTKGYAA